MPRDVALEPEERATNWRRGAAKALLAIVLSGVASIGIGVTFAIYMPMATHDRIVIGGILVPVLWGGGMAWTLSDAKLLRATLLLLAISAACYGMAFLPKVGSPDGSASRQGPASASFCRRTSCAPCWPATRRSASPLPGSSTSSA